MTEPLEEIKATECEKVTKAGFCWRCYFISYRKRTDELRAIKERKKIYTPKTIKKVRPITKIRKARAVGNSGLCAACLKEDRQKPTPKVMPKATTKHKQCTDCGKNIRLRAMQNAVMRCRPCQTTRTRVLNKIRNAKRYKKGCA